MSARSFKSLLIQEGRHILLESLPVKTAPLWSQMMYWLETLDNRYFQPHRIERIDEYHAFVEDATRDKKAYLALDPQKVNKPQFLTDRKLAIGHLTVQQILLNEMCQDTTSYTRCTHSNAQVIRDYQERWIRTHNEEFGYLLSVREHLPEMKRRDELIMRRLFGSRSWWL